ncbi:MAG TPA: helix-turn-helix domain-containing protein [Micropepsaceae bacterium]|nr:helix-turn-helix domain-containing protein [Micropepsaceae bacterium]
MGFELTARERKAASEAARLLARGSTGLRLEARIKGKGAPVALPARAVAVLRSALEIMAQGRKVSIHAPESELTTQQAAELLGVSRPHVIKLIKSGALACRMTGAHRRIALADVTRLKRTQEKSRRRVLGRLTAEAQELDQGY